MGEVVLARTSPTLASPIPSHCALIVVTSTVRVKNECVLAYIVGGTLSHCDSDDGFDITPRYISSCVF